MLVSTSVFLSSKNPPRDLKLLDKTDTDFIHVDVKDGKFVSGKTMPFSEMKNIYKYTSKRLDVHLMVLNSSSYIRDYASLNTEYITIHIESNNVKENLELIRNYGIKAGLAINLDTPFSEIVPFLPLINQILIMSIVPGDGGQAFIIEAIDKIDEARVLVQEYKLDIIINVDGGINDKTINYCKKADMVVSGSYIVLSDNFQEKIDSLRI